MNVALMGGSFNPPHVGHLLAAHYVRATQPVGEVWLMPSFHHPFGKPMVDFRHRLRMCEALCVDASGWLKASDVEKDVGGGGWTVDTLEYLQRTRVGDAFTLVIGSDILKDLPSWKDFDRIRKLARVLVIHRSGHPAPEALGPPLVQISSTDIRDALARGEAPTDRVPRAVLEYIREHSLYRD